MTCEVCNHPTSVHGKQGCVRAIFKCIPNTEHYALEHCREHTNCVRSFSHECRCTASIRYQP